MIVVIVVGACHEPRVDMPPRGSQGSGVFVADAVTRSDANLWTHRPNERRGVRVTIGIPAGTDSVVIKRVEGGAQSDGHSVEFIEVNSVPVLAPSKLRRISVRSGDGGEMNVELMVKLGHCTRLDLVAVRYWGGGPADGSVGELPQKHELPDCCVHSFSREILDTSDARGDPADAALPTGKPRARMNRLPVP